MTLVQWESLQRVVNFNLQTQNLVNSFLKTRYSSVLWVGNGGYTRISDVQVKETETKIIVHIKTPTINLAALEIRITPETLLIQGEQREKAEIVDYFYIDYPTEEFKNLIPFPHPIDLDSAEIRIEGDNTLILILSKSVTSQHQTIKVFLPNK